MLKRNITTKVALVLSILLIVLWIILGANTSIAWFQQEDTIVNSLNFGDFNVELYYKDGGDYKLVDSQTKIFNEEALYEPGYTQIVYLKIKNAGTIDFKYDMSVIPDMGTIVEATNVYGGTISLPDYLRFGLVYAPTEEELLTKTADRELARNCATRPLSNYSENAGTLAPYGEAFCALILYMPETVGNEANYRGDIIPKVEVGVGVLAKQIDITE